MFFVGRLIDRFGSRRTSLWSAALLGVACLVNSVVWTPTVLFLGFFLARFAGKGALALSAQTVAPHWFSRRRAFAIMLVGLGGTAGSVAFPLFNSFLINSIGWRAAFRVLAAGIWVLYIPIAFVLLISRPEEIGLKPDGVTGSLGKRESTEEKAFTQPQAIRTAGFWILALCVFQSAMIGTGAVLHFVSIFEEAGFPMDFAAGMLSIRPAVGFGTFFIMGLVLDRVRRPKFVLAATCLGQVVALLMLAFLRGTAMALAYSVVAGASGRGAAYCVSVLYPRLFGRRHIGGILGVATAINVIGTAIGPFLFGSVYDLVGGYREVLVVSALLPLLSAVSSLFIRRTLRPGD
jgi:MFS family permease